MGRRPSRAADPRREPKLSPDPVPLREIRRAKAEMSFEDQSLLGALFGQFDANLVQVENRLGVVPEEKRSDAELYEDVSSAVLRGTSAQVKPRHQAMPSRRQKVSR